MANDTKHEKKRKHWLFWVLVVGVPMLALVFVVVVVGAGLLLEYTSKDLPVSEAEWDVVIDAQDVAAWVDGMAVNRRSETLSKVRFFDFSYEVAYEYEDDHDGIYINHTLNVERKASDALATYAPLWAATKAGFLIGGEGSDITVEEHDVFFQWGDQSRFAVLHNNGEPFGNLFIARKRKRVVFLILAGVYFDEPELWEAFVTPSLEASEAYDPDK